MVAKGPRWDDAEVFGDTNQTGSQRFSIPKSTQAVEAMEHSAENASNIFHELGKRVLVFAGATIAIGAIVAVASKLFHKNPPTQDQNWADQAQQNNSQTRSL